MISKTTNKIETIDLVHTDEQIKLFKILVQILLYILNLLMEIDEVHGFFEESETASITKVEEMLNNKLSGKADMLKILESKPHHCSSSDTKLNNVHSSEINFKRRKHNYELNL